MSFWKSWQKAYTPFERARFFVVIGLGSIAFGFLAFVLGNIFGFILFASGVVFFNISMTIAKCPSCGKSLMISYWLGRDAKFRWLSQIRHVWPEQDCSDCGAALDRREGEV